MKKFCLTCGAIYLENGLECDNCSGKTEPSTSPEKPSSSQANAAEYSQLNVGKHPSKLLQEREPDGSLKLSWELIVGIIFIPHIFSWFTLRKGYSRRARIFAAWPLFLILIAAVIQIPLRALGIIEVPNQAPPLVAQQTATPEVAPTDSSESRDSAASSIRENPTFWKPNETCRMLVDLGYVPTNYTTVAGLDDDYPYWCWAQKVVQGTPGNPQISVRYFAEGTENQVTRITLTTDLFDGKFLNSSRGVLAKLSDDVMQRLLGQDLPDSVRRGILSGKGRSWNVQGATISLEIKNGLSAGTNIRSNLYIKRK